MGQASPVGRRKPLRSWSLGAEEGFTGDVFHHSVYAMQHFQSHRNPLQPSSVAANWLASANVAGSHDRCRRPYSVVQPSFGDGGDVHAGSAAESGLGTGDGSRPGSDEDEDPIARRMRAEAVLLLAKAPLTTRKLAQLAHLADGTEARTLVRQLNQLYDELGRAIRIEQVAGGYRMLSRAAYAPWLGRLEHLPSAIRLSSPMMETLAVVAYRGPVSRADVEAIRGVACGELLRQLMERDLIRISGRSEELGRPYLYDTTKQFLEVFGLPSTDALPPIDWNPLQDDSVDPDPESSTSNFDLK